MTLRHFRIFQTVCRLSSMTAAANELHISQPSVSQAVRELEEHYGTALFDRIGRQLHLTSAGRALYGYATHILSLEHQAGEAMRGFAERGPLAVGATLSIGESVFVPMLAEFRATHPDVPIFSRIANTHDLEQRLLADDLDVALIEGDVHSAQLTAKPFLVDELVLLASPARGLAGTVPREAIAGAPFLLREEGSGTRALFEAVMQAGELPYETAGVYNNSASILQAVAADLGLAALSERIAAPAIAAGGVTTFTVPGIRFHRTFRVVCHQNKYLTPTLRAFLAFCEGIGREKAAR
ncbi:LysR substrate-binding domain-containing protein [Selenomonas sp.]|uniref:LysR family transcriptional regulator n=1 Tax=Selenomonas sp. TaxID=2053611 RepID=UPI0025CC2F0D|nr:LysR substrate-binding domain-containing protein [Selenomonas sp.]MCI6284819.1 LysR substrate-binding domain-containing protein [Selenomonas sp.]